MMRVVVALGGNALGQTPHAQETAAREAANVIADLVQGGNEVLITHGNGPQVGMIALAFERANDEAVPDLPLPEATAMSAGYIGYHLQKALFEVFAARGIDKEVCALTNMVVVDANDPAFSEPTKPIGAFYGAQEAKRMELERGQRFCEDAGRGFRRVVASPAPQRVIGTRGLSRLLESGFLVIACGGGGVPITKDADARFSGAAAVVDKDLAAALLAKDLHADLLLILTAVDRVCVFYGTPSERALEHLSPQTARAYCEAGHFAPGSMLPKVQAAIAFAESGERRRAVIASLSNATAALLGRAGTVIENAPAPIP